MSQSKEICPNPENIDYINYLEPLGPQLSEVDHFEENES